MAELDLGLVVGPAGVGVPSGGTTGQVLKKKSAADYDTEWEAAGTADALPLAGGTMSGSINMDGNRVTGLGTPSASGDAVPKSYADALLTGYRTAAAQDAIDAAQDADIASRAKADEIGIVITGARPSMVVSAGQYVIVRGSTITGITDGLYTAVNALSPSTDVSAADLTAVSGGGLNNVMEHGLRVRVIAKNPSTATEVRAKGFVDFSLDTSASQNFIDAIGIYASRPQLLITNIFRSSGIWTVTIFNPTDSNLTLNTARQVRILEFYNA